VNNAKQDFLIFFIHIDSLIEILEQSHLYPLREHPGGQTQFCLPPGIEPGPPATQAGTLPKELSGKFINIYSEHVHMSPRQFDIFRGCYKGRCK
jgi:hypothetical protein